MTSVFWRLYSAIERTILAKFVQALTSFSYFDGVSKLVVNYMYSSGTDRSRLKCDGTPGGNGEEGGEGASSERVKDRDLGKGKAEGKKKEDVRIRGEDGRGGE